MPYSYSSWSTYNKCAAKYKYSYIDRIPGEAPSPQMARGTDLHDAVEKYLLGQLERMPKELHKLNGMYMEQIKASYDLYPEEKWAVDKKWEPVDFDDPNAFMRGVFDLRAEREGEIKIFEWKTGKMYDEHADQSHLYATVALTWYETQPKVPVDIRYLDFGTNKTETYSRDMYKMMKLRWRDRIKQIEKDKTFAPNPSYACRWCAYSGQKGGPCPVG